MKYLILFNLILSCNFFCIAQTNFLHVYNDLDGFPTYFNDMITDFSNMNGVTSVKVVKLKNPYSVQDSGRVNFTTNGDCPSRILKPLAANYIDSTSYLWRGVSYDTLLDVTFIKNTSGHCGTIRDRLNDDFYRIMPLDSVYSALLKVEHSDFTCDYEMAEEFPESNNANCVDVCPGHIDILFLIPPNVTISDPKSTFDLLLSDLQAAFQNSNIPHTVAYYYTSTTWDNFNIDDCQNDAKAISGNLSINALKFSYGADLVVMIAPTNIYTSPFKACVAEIGPTINLSTAIVPIDVILEDHTFVHEVGHLFGGLHKQDKYWVEVAPCASAHVLTAIEKNTIMGFHKPRILHFSDPDIIYGTHPTGTTLENNAGRIRGTGCVVAEFNESIKPNAIITTEINSCSLGKIDLESHIDFEYNNFDYEWYWNLTGIFTGLSPDYYLGSGSTLTINQPISDPCENYFIHLKVKNVGNVVASTTTIQRGGICTENVQCDEPPPPSSRQIDYNTTNPKLIKEYSEAFEYGQNLNKQYKLYNAYGQIVAETNDLNEIKENNTIILPMGIYFVIEINNNRIIQTFKLFITQNY